jgi:ferric-dicitrate binding protein FerR (iron transport regulator)
MADNELINSRWQYLIGRYLNDACSKEELDELLTEVEKNSDRDILLEEFHKYWNNSGEVAARDETVWEEQFDKMMEHIHRMQLRPVLLRRRWQIAAAILILVGGAALWLLNKPVRQNEELPNNSLSEERSIQPGGNKAILILANGTIIGLDSVQNGVLASQGNTKVLKTGNGQLAYNAAIKGSDKVLYNTVVTPRGGQYEIVLPDDTKVWLNAGSSLKFPTMFTGKERQVELRGEGYFEVAKDEKMPFKVKVNNMEVEVLGTKFNVMAYDDEKTINTTLLEGSVSVSAKNNDVLLKQGQQAALNRVSGQMMVVKATADAVAWKDGLFRFNDTDLKTIMRQIARWYDVEVSYQGDIPGRTFTGTMPRTVSLSHVLEVLTLSNVHFKVIGRKIVVTP